MTIWTVTFSFQKNLLKKLKNSIIDCVVCGGDFYVYGSMNLKTCIDLCNYHHNQNIEQLHYSKNLPLHTPHP